MKAIYLYWLFGLFSLLGRYDFSPKHLDYAMRRYILSALLFSALIFFVGIKLNSHRILAPLTLIFCLPYHFLTLDKYFYHLKNPVLHHWQSPNYPTPKLDWFPGALQNLPVIPHELPFFLTLTGFLILSFYYLCKKFKIGTAQLKLGTLCILMLSLQTWLHLSMRSPYTYVPHFEGPAKDNYWFHYYLFPNQKGAVNLDYLAFRVGEELFWGTQTESNPLLSRAFPTYLASQFTAFINPLYVWLSLNICFWFSAVIALYLLARYLFDEKTALFSAFLMTSNQSVILYIGQPKVYAIAICLLVPLLLTQIKLLSTVQPTKKEVAFFAILIFFFQLSYEAQPWIIGLLCLSYFIRKRLKETAVAIALGFGAYYSYLQIAMHLPHIQISNTLTPIAGNPTQNIIELLASGNLWNILISVLKSIRGFGRCLIHCFQLTMLPAIAGLWLAPKKQRWLFACLLISPFLTYAYFELGNNWLYTRFPRLVQLAYPAIFLLAGVALAKLESKNKLIAWGFIFVNFIYLNMDVWGQPWIYYLWFYRNPGYSFTH